MSTLGIITIAFLISIFFSELFHHIKYPRVIGQIVAGIIIGLPIFGQYITGDVLIDIRFLADIGVIFLFLLIGLELDINRFRKVTHSAAIVGVLGIVIPFALGFILMQFLGYSFPVSILTGIALSITAEATTAQILEEIRALNSKVGEILIGAGLMDDLFGIIALTVLVSFVGHDGTKLWQLPFYFIGFAVVIWLLFKVIPMILHHIQHEDSRVAGFSTVVGAGLVIAVLASMMGVGEIIGAFLAGLIINFYESHKCTKSCGPHCRHKGYAQMRARSIDELKVVTLSFIIPFFFIFVGLQFSFQGFAENVWLILAITSIAIIGKFAGAKIAGAMMGLTKDQSSFIGWGMNSRGVVELVLANIALSRGIIDRPIYTAIVAMALITTLLFPIFMKYYLRKDPKILKGE